MTRTLWDVDQLEHFARGYAEWIQMLVDRDHEYTAVMELLYRTEFTWVLDKDENRATDGCVLRARYAEISGEEWLDWYEDWPCSVLEMLVALAYKIDDQMYEPTTGHVPERWFWVMMENLGLTRYPDLVFYEDPTNSEEYVLARIQIFMDRKPGPSLFPGVDKNAEIWQQMNQWIMQTFK